MNRMIKGYVESCELVRTRIRELTVQRAALREQGDILAIKELDLDRRIKLLYKEYGQMQEIIDGLTSYMRRREQSAEA